MIVNQPVKSLKIYQVIEPRYNLRLGSQIFGALVMLSTFIYIYLYYPHAAFKPTGIFFILAPLIILYKTYIEHGIYSVSKNMVLILHSDQQTFQFGKGKNITIYNKSEIIEVHLHGFLGIREPNSLTIMKIKFNNGITISFSGMLMSPTDFLTEFSSQNLIHDVNIFKTIRERWIFTK